MSHVTCSVKLLVRYFDAEMIMQIIYAWRVIPLYKLFQIELRRAYWLYNFSTRLKLLNLEFDNIS